MARSWRPDVLAARRHLRPGATCGLSWPGAVKESWRLVGGLWLASGYFWPVWWAGEVYDRYALGTHCLCHLEGSAGAAQGRWPTGIGSPEALALPGVSGQGVLLTLGYCLLMGNTAMAWGGDVK